MNKLMLSVLILMPLTAVAAVGPHSSFSELYADRFHRPLTQVIPFYVSASTGVGSKLILAKVHDISYYRDADGELMLYAGDTRVCSRFSVTGSISATRRRCLAYETVPVVRPAEYSYKYCVFRTDDDCGRYIKTDNKYSLKYEVEVVKRMAESDSFNYADVAFIKTVELPYCNQCEAMNWRVPKAGQQK